MKRSGNMRAYLVFANVDGAERRATVWAENRPEAWRKARAMFPTATNLVVL